MPQTTLALLALALVTMFTLNQREMTTHTQLAMMRNEIGVVATGVAAELFDRTSALAFDKNAPVTSPALLTPPSGFGAAKSWDHATAIDQLHGKATKLSVPTDYGVIDIEATANVSYVRKVGESFVPTETPAYLKQVTFNLSGPLGYTAEITRVFSYFD